MLEVGVAIHEDFFVGDELRDFHGEDEVVGRLARPAGDGGGGGSAVEGGVHFDGVEFGGVVGEVVGGFHAGGVERGFPAGRRKGAGAEMDLTKHARDSNSEGGGGEGVPFVPQGKKTRSWIIGRTVPL